MGKICTLFLSLTGRSAEVADRESAFAHPLVPEEYRSIIERACAFDPRNRYGSVEDLQRAFALATDKYVRDFDNIPEEAESKAGRFRPDVGVKKTKYSTIRNHNG